jgi:hypothetical protein
MSDDLFRLGWLEDPKLELARKGVTELADKAKNYAGQGVFEDDTRAIFVETLLRGLGWDTLEHDEVDRELPGDHPPIGDIHLFGKDLQAISKVAEVIEVKALDEHNLISKAYWQLHRDIHDRLFTAGNDFTRKVLLRFDGRPTVRGVLTTGASWITYHFDPNTEDLNAKEHKPVCEFELQGGTDAAVSAFVGAIGRRHLLGALCLLGA